MGYVFVNTMRHVNLDTTTVVAYASEVSKIIFLGPRGGTAVSFSLFFSKIRSRGTQKRREKGYQRMYWYETVFAYRFTLFVSVLR